uniref:Uncharacterized protein n=2 Tax=Desulfobacterium TaxID=2295 RepID=E1YKF3_9BACT|nr:unknown protein [uncultured Desulfobacterium sp.]
MSRNLIYQIVRLFEAFSSSSRSYSVPNYRLSDKIYNTTHGFIEPLGKGALRRCNMSFVKEGTAVHLLPVYRRLQSVIESDAGLLSTCIKEAAEWGTRGFNKVHLRPTYHELKKALESDDTLLTICIKEAIKRGHVLY